MGTDGSEATAVDHDARRLSFGQAARGVRPDPPDVPAGSGGLGARTHSRRVVDLGAGTGLHDAGARSTWPASVLPVEPDAGMRAQPNASTPGVRALAGSAEQIPLPDASVDAVIAGQAYHWFDQDKAHAEIARVLRPGGVLRRSGTSATKASSGLRS